MKDLVAEQNARLEAVTNQACARLSTIATDLYSKMQDFADTLHKHLYEATSEAGGVLASFRAEADQIVKDTRAQMALKQAEFFGEPAPDLPRTNDVPVDFELVVTADEGGRPIGHSMLRAAASRIVTEAGEVLKDVGPDAVPPVVQLHQSEIADVANENGLSLASAFDMARALKIAFRRKVTGKAAPPEGKGDEPEEPPADKAACGRLKTTRLSGCR